MRKSSKALSLIFLAAASVYSGRVDAGAPAKVANGSDGKNTDVKLLEDRLDPFAAPATQPTTNPSSPTVPPTMNSNVDGTFSLNITNGADLVETLRVIGFQAQKSVLPSKEVRATLPALDLYNVTVREALDAILKVNGYVYKEEGNFIYVYSMKEAADIEKANRVRNTEVFRVYYTPAANAMNLIKPLVSGDGQIAVTTPAVSGIASGVSDAGGNSHSTEDLIVVTDYTDNLDKIRKLLKEIDRRPQQILIEATIVRAALTEDNALGIDFNVVGGVDFSSLTSSNGQITNAGINTTTLAGSDNVNSVGTGNAFTSGVGNGLKMGFVSNNISVFLSALEGVTDTEVLANPKVLALNKQRGEVIVGRKDGYLTTTTTDTSTVQTVDFLDTGTRLVFRPYIGDDGYIRMEIHPEDSSGGLSSANLPFKITTEVTSNVMVKDGRTIVIGGLFRESSTTGRSQIPGLGSLPVAGALFRQQRDQTTREEIIILLTPHIVKDDSAYADASEELLKFADQMRVGVRKGMMWWGRERLAETAYESAVREMNKPNPNRTLALWHLECATNLNPKFAEAIQMKQDLTGRVLSESDNSAIRGFVKRQILAERHAARAAADTNDADEALIPSTQPGNEPATQPAVVRQEMSVESDDSQPMPMTAPRSPAAMPMQFGMMPSLQMRPEDMMQMPATQPAMQPATAMQPAMQAEPATAAPAPAAPAPQMSSLRKPSMPSPMNSFFEACKSMLSLGRPPTTEPSHETAITELPNEDATVKEPDTSGGGDWNK